MSATIRSPISTYAIVSFLFVISMLFAHRFIASFENKTAVIISFIIAKMVSLLFAWIYNLAVLSCSHWFPNCVFIQVKRFLLRLIMKQDAMLISLFHSSSRCCLYDGRCRRRLNCIVIGYTVSIYIKALHHRLVKHLCLLRDHLMLIHHLFLMSQVLVYASIRIFTWNHRHISHRYLWLLSLDNNFGLLTFKDLGNFIVFLRLSINKCILTLSLRFIAWVTLFALTFFIVLFIVIFIRRGTDFWAWSRWVWSKIFSSLIGVIISRLCPFPISSHI